MDKNKLSQQRRFLKMPSAVSRWIAGVLVVAFSINGAFLVAIDSVPEDLARGKAAELSGIRRDNLVVAQARNQCGMMSRNASVTFRDKENHARLITVGMTRTFHFLPWSLGEYSDNG